jgi:hypothetical protein
MPPLPLNTPFSLLALVLPFNLNQIVPPIVYGLTIPRANKIGTKIQESRLVAQTQCHFCSSLIILQTSRVRVVAQKYHRPLPSQKKSHFIIS